MDEILKFKGWKLGVFGEWKHPSHHGMSIDVDEYRLVITLHVKGEEGRTEIDTACEDVQEFARRLSGLVDFLG